MRAIKDGGELGLRSPVRRARTPPKMQIPLIQTDGSSMSQYGEGVKAVGKVYSHFLARRPLLSSRRRYIISAMIPPKGRATTLSKPNL